MKTKLILAAGMMMASASASALDFGVGVKAGTVGFGADVSIVLTQTINLRASFTQADFNESDTIEIQDSSSGDSAAVDAQLNLDFGSTALLFDWYPFDGTFHVTAGLMKNDSSMNVSGTLKSINGTGSVSFNGTNYQITDFVDPTVGGNLSFGDSFEPYLGIGWGRKADDDPGFALSFEIGVVMMDPKVDFNQYPQLTAAALAVPGAPDQAQLQADIDAAEATANQDLDDFELYPVISLGLNYAF